MTLAFLLVNHIVYRSFGNPSPIVPILEHRFWRCFEIFCEGLYPLDTQSEGLLLWLAFTGVISHTRRKCPYIGTAVSALVNIRKGNQHRELQTFDKVREDVLDKYLWSRPVQEHICVDVWRQLLERESRDNQEEGRETLD